MDKEDVMVLLDANLQPIWDEQFEQSARITTVRFLLEDLFADKYADRLPDFTARMERLLEMTRTASVNGGSVGAEQLREMQVRVATHLERFRGETERKIVARSSK
ncbi:hypothetical protein [Variovorax sp. 54]|uniref:hypothetical protein n=1 Tax=Variovorax sp. 54 TaxID=2035212 RepID=UPI00117FA8D0|nr:hypothetical protein [Variovorax sp. 54]